MGTFAESLRRWRRHRRLSQLALSGEADVSARHLSFLESGRAHPSADMVLRLAAALEVPLAGVNALMQEAGFAARHGAGPLEGRALARVSGAVDRILEGHDPWPGFAVDTAWRLQRMNRGGGGAVDATGPRAR